MIVAGVGCRKGAQAAEIAAAIAAAFVRAGLVPVALTHELLEAERVGAERYEQRNARHSGAPRSGEPGIRDHGRLGLWIPGSRLAAEPRNDAVYLRVLQNAGLALIATSAAKGGEPGIAEAAAAIGVPLVLVPQDDLEAAGSRAVTTSPRVVALFGVPSVAEAAALAAGGRSARLIAPRTAVGPATCALVDTGESP